MRLKNLPSKHHHYLLIMALLLSSIAISIRGSGGEIRLAMHQHPALIALLVVVSSCLVAIYFHLNTRKITSLSHPIMELSQTPNQGNDALLHELTERQREVYDLIIAGKTNKEIMSELFIEKSTLKTHINHTYRKLEVKSRRELKSK